MDVAILAAAAALRRRMPHLDPDHVQSLAAEALQAARPYTEVEVAILRDRSRKLELLADAAFRYFHSATAHLVDDDIYDDFADALAAVEEPTPRRDAA